MTCFGYVFASLGLTDTIILTNILEKRCLRKYFFLLAVNSLRYKFFFDEKYQLSITWN